MEFIQFTATVSQRLTLLPGDAVTLTFRPYRGDAGVTTSATGTVFDPPVEPDPDKPQHPQSQQVTVRFEVFPPEASQPVVSTPLWLSLPSTIARVPFTIPEAGGNWRAVLTNTSSQTILLGAEVSFPAVRRSETTWLPHRVLNHAFQQLVTAVGPSIVLDDGKAVISLSPDVAELLGEEIPPIVRDVDAPVDLNDIRLGTVKVAAVPGTVIGDPGLRLLVDFETHGPEEVTFGSIDLANLQRAGITSVMRLESVPRGHGEGRLVPSFSVSVDVQAELTALASVVLRIARTSMAELLGVLQKSLYQGLNSAPVKDLIGRYLSLGFAQLGARGHVLHDLRYEATASGPMFRIRHFDPAIPSSADGGELPPPRDDTPHRLPDDGPTFPRDPGRLPPRQPDPPDLDKLRNIGNIVVLMQENRSFDHMFGYLRLAGRTDVDGLTGTERNVTSGNRDIGVAPLPDTYFPLSPDHRFVGVAEQVAEGSMAGFLASFLRRFPAARFDLPNFSPLAYHTAATLPVYSFFAENYLICDRWFCSLPGPTLPNRFCTLSGRTPVLENYEVDDPILGFLKLPTIFDLLTENKIDWRYYEHDVATLRFYDRYRLNDRNVVPFHDPVDGFFARAKAGKLPPVTFIDPDFVDIPPFGSANDDHPPADVANGQRLISEIYTALVRSPQWGRTLFVITYDEHGGFFDHVPPPGTKAARAQDEAAGRTPLQPPPVHPDGPAELGVRVPALVASPWVPRRGVSSVVFDHTSIGRTILLRFLGAGAGGLSPRMARAAHLGQLLSSSFRSDRPQSPGAPPPPRPKPTPSPPPNKPREPRDPDEPRVPRRPGPEELATVVRPPVPLPAPAGGLPEKDDFHHLIRTFGRPIP